MYHPRLKGDPYRAGRHYAEILYKNGFRFPQVTEEKLHYGKSCIPILNEFDSDIVKEIHGFADGCHASFEEVSSFLLSIGVFEPSGQCSIFAAFNGKEVIIGRNYDMLFSLKKITESPLICFDDKNKYLGHSDCFIGKVDGINEHGLFVGITAVPHEGIKLGLNFYISCKHILENCSNVAEGIEVLKSFPSSVANNYLLADPSGSMVVVEVTPNECNVRLPKNNYIHCTNHHVGALAVENWNWSKSKDRFETLDRVLAENVNNMTLSIAKSIMSETKGHVCLNLTEHKFGTLFSVVANLNTIEITRAEGMPNKAKYTADQRLTEAILKEKKKDTVQ
ncbi:C45 family autoproteolytic acyltransferase/hydrolase [Bacillus cereus group sp. Bc191]|uniref:C45 family autoproteolytic acyltransferase/hydolase n=1 Tax=Bacillus cereus group sp. Bc191 TaxID=3018113 RepID=UPI0022E55CF8|nr:C45 family peptidase [Bacillus cereus group sp. Bc191]MDA2043902.1 C45 family autoproteolytic acyltransferase/hydrolase [Bacillus cereus]MDA2290759.1 C45 family autoproteolytic acyltransferase/hydrolase [Bacillus cereus group sp. Bc191]